MVGRRAGFKKGRLGQGVVLIVVVVFHRFVTIVVIGGLREKDWAKVAVGVDGCVAEV